MISDKECNVMTKEEAVERLKTCKEKDVETGHGEADNILCELLCFLGYEEVVKEYDEIEKWYA